MILGYLLLVPYWIEYKIRCARDWVRTRLKG